MSSRSRHEEPTSYGLQPPAAAPAAGDEDAAGGGHEATAVRPPHVRTGTGADRQAGAGRLVGGRYRLLERLGAGGMGTVWRARDEVVERDVAIKEPQVPENLGAAERRTAFLRIEREARAAARIDHPSVVTIHDVVSEAGRPWIVMELLRGKSLAELLDEGTLAPAEAARIGLAVLGALAAAHEAGVLHRDVKPGNVMVGRHDRVVLTDFGIAQVEGEQKLTETGAFIGSPEYIAPERVLGRRPGPESDLWSLGVMLYLAVEGVSPFRRQTTASTLQAVLLAELPPPQNAGELTGLITGLLRKEPEGRLTAQAAQPLLHTLTLPVPPPPPRHPPVAAPGRAAAAQRPVWRRHPRMSVAVAAVAALAVTAATVVLTDQDDVPAGWKRYDEYRMNLSVAAPADWTITTEDSLGTEDGPYRGTRYTSPKGDMSLLVDRKEKVTETPRAVAERWKSEHEAAVPPNGGSPSVATIESTTHQGRDAAVITESYSENSDGTPRRLSKVLIVTTSGQERLTLGFNLPDGKTARKTADDLLTKARATFRIRNL
ncbi:serine/threonine-protein kinase [Streptomyces flaveolus]|uniref:serine/threonine-protein kinase n=1 Tax=Streptomyces flaveolus TaxID=67297 RepID=UPI001E5B710C|nr:serine/threonine-protein kinase [Streptomyces flaveolus]